jgi:exodeoxyribonuclease VII large subunit
MFKQSRIGGLDFELRDGQSVEVSGEIRVYEKGGIYNLYARQIVLGGVGLLYEKYEALKKQLYAEGLFDPSHKKPLPPFVNKLGIVTASTGAALHDIMDITRRRNPYVQMVLAPAKVQGEGAALTVIKALQRLESYGVDVIIVGRGGGSIEDLWAFNDEALARTVYSLKTPVISAVGHETDTTIIDYVSDKRAPTPSAAAELAIYEYRALSERFVDYHSDLLHSVYDTLERTRERLASNEQLLTRLSPRARIDQKNQELDEAAERLNEILGRKLEAAKSELERIPNRMNELIKRKLELTKSELDYAPARMKELLERQLDQTKTSLNYVPERINTLFYRKLDLTKSSLRLAGEQLSRYSPLEKITKGYAYISKQNKSVKSIKELNEGDALSLTFVDGTARCQVSELEANTFN